MGNVEGLDLKGLQALEQDGLRTGDLLTDSSVSDTAQPAGRVLMLDRWLDHLEELVAFRIHQAVGEIPATHPRADPDVRADLDESAFCRFVVERKLSADEVMLLVISLAPWVRPDLFDRVVAHCLSEGGNFEAMGGVRGKQHRSFLPTGDTVLFLLAGCDTQSRLWWQSQLLGDSEVIRQGLVYVDSPMEGEPPMSGRLMIDPDTAEFVLTGAYRAPRMSALFPAQRLETGLNWDSLVLPAKTREQINELRAWMRHKDTLLDGWGMRKKLRPGCRALFFGPPGTGKTLTATLLGQITSKQVYRVDLSMVVSKYIGETEKNLAALFDKAENKDWILFFDEADSLFGKRSQVRDSRDRYANQEISFLLQRIEVFDGLAILASNLSNNVDSAFSRRFEHMVHFPMPKPNERLALWKKSLPEDVKLEPGLDLVDIATRYELSGGTIMNIVRHCCLQAISRGSSLLRQADFEEGVRREYAKENRLQ